MAFYFAARGEGFEVHDDGTRKPYTSSAKVFFSGLGADEQLGCLSMCFYLIEGDIPAMRLLGRDQMVTGQP
jgi:asparagine synthetase B (glutamine-hydrolysing)